MHLYARLTRRVREICRVVESAESVEPCQVRRISKADRNLATMLDIYSFDDVFSFNPVHSYPAATVTLIQGNRKKLGGRLFVERLFGVLGVDGADEMNGRDGDGGGTGGDRRKSEESSRGLVYIIAQSLLI